MIRKGTKGIGASYLTKSLALQLTRPELGELSLQLDLRPIAWRKMAL